MSAITGPLVLPSSVRIVPVASLAREVRAHLGGVDGDAALTDPGSRTPSRLVDGETARLLEEFRTPATVVEAVLRFCAGRDLDPDSVLQAAFEPLSHLLADGFLVAAGAVEAHGTNSALSRGTRFGDFEILEVCQSTEDGEVVQARGRIGVVALKIERAPSSSRALPSSQPLEYEGAVVAHLAGSVAPRLLASGCTEGRRWLAFEWLRGAHAETVARELRSGSSSRPYDRARLWSLGTSILDAYAELHAKEVVHGDVHPRNLLLSPGGGLRVIDFGSSSWLGAPADLARPERGGVACFYEPECARSMLAGEGPTPPTRQGEQFSLAALIDLLLTGAPYRPFALTREAMLRQIAEEAPRSFEERDVEGWAEAEAVLARALRKEPEERYPSVRAFAEAWRALEPRASRPQGRERPDRRHRGRLCQRALARLSRGGEACDEPIPKAPSASIFFGATGRAGALLQMARAGGEAELLSLADFWTALAAAQAATPSAWLAAPWGLTDRNVRPDSPYYGAAGLPLVETWLARALGEPELEGAAFARFAGWVRDGCAQPRAELDLTLGLSGALLACANLLPGAPAEVRGAIAALGEEVHDRIWGELGLHPPVGGDPAVRSLGLAHGWAGMLYAALRWRRAAGLRLPPVLGERLDQLAELAEPWGRGLRWRCLAEDGRDFGSVTGWCNGSAGFVFLWDEAERHRADPRFAELRTGAAWNAWEGPDEGFDLCCGVAGRSYALLAEFRRTGDERWLGRAEALAERAARLALRQDDAPDSLFKGALGVAVLSVDLERPETAAFPIFEEER